LRPGDLVFFRDTNDLNGNGKPDDGVTWVAVLEQIHQDRLIVIGQRAGRVRRMAVSSQRPHVTRDPSGKVVNTRIVKWPNESQAWTTGRCFAGFGRP
ncbi:MAG TPA: hypothetical protein DCQ06_02170, partial [Myxococcales bacterium]|nr:hypothetical protein [Myxococcales bacterium]